MKEKGFTVIELMVVVAIVGILLTIMIGAMQPDNEAETTYTEPTYDDVPPLYIDNDRRTNKTVTIQRHSDGSLWACIENSKCYEVVE